MNNDDLIEIALTIKKYYSEFDGFIIITGNSTMTY